jgi:hypothetical protein
MNNRVFSGLDFSFFAAALVFVKIYLGDLLPSG